MDVTFFAPKCCRTSSRITVRLDRISVLFLILPKMNLLFSHAARLRVFWPPQLCQTKHKVGESRTLNDQAIKT
jgi:hypothetical protein